MNNRHKFVPPADPHAEPVCNLTRELALQREEPPDKLLSRSLSESSLSNGIEYKFRREPGIWERAETFITEEAICCPFLSFELFEERDSITLRILSPA